MLVQALQNLGGSGSRPGLYHVFDIDGHLVVPFVPLKDAYPIYRIFIYSIHAVDHRGWGECRQSHRWYGFLATSIDDLCSFVGAEPHRRRFCCGEAEDSHLTHEIKELSVLATTVLSAGTAFLKYNAPPALIYGGSGCPGIGEHGFGHVHFCQSGIVPADCGRDFYFSVLSSIIQRLFFKWMLHTRGRGKAERFRFSSDPYHHHLQRLWTYNRNPSDVESVWLIFLKKIGINPVPEEKNC